MTQNKHRNKLRLIFFKKWASPVGELFLYADENKLLAVSFIKNRDEVEQRLGLTQGSDAYSSVLELALEQLQEYFAGQRRDFDVPLELSGTPFQMRAWTYLSSIPMGRTVSYTEQAKEIQAAHAVRAVGSANAKNPLAIFVPCHRVLGSNGKVSGYSGGTAIKRQLLEWEGWSFPKLQEKRAHAGVAVPYIDFKSRIGRPLRSLLHIFGWKGL